MGIFRIEANGIPVRRHIAAKSRLSGIILESRIDNASQRAKSASENSTYVDADGYCAGVACSRRAVSRDQKGRALRSVNIDLSRLLSLPPSSSLEAANHRR
jgi:hypothetical protein